MTPHRRHVCQECLAHRALFAYRGAVRADRHHTLCFACYRAERDRQRARLLGGTSPAPQLSLPLAAVHDAAPVPAAGSGTTGRVLTPSQWRHRRRMLSHLEATTRASAPGARGCHAGAGQPVRRPR